MIQRRVETEYGEIEINVYLSTVEPIEMIATIVDSHSYYPEIPPIVINGIPIRFYFPLSAPLNIDLTDADNWKCLNSFCNRLEFPFQKATHSQFSKSWKMVKTEITRLFGGPCFLKEVLISSKQDEIEKLEQQAEEEKTKLRQTNEKLLNSRKDLADMRNQ